LVPYRIILQKANGMAEKIYNLSSNILSAIFLHAIYIYICCLHRKAKYIFLKKIEVASPSAWAMTLGEEGF
jgi:hypothetical protein